MRFFSSLLCAAAAGVAAASSWTFDDATVSVQGKGSGVGGGVKEKFSASSPLSSAISLGATDTLKIILTTKDGKSAKRAHQTFLTLRDPTTGLSESFPFSVKESGKGTVSISPKDIPSQLLTTNAPIDASIVIGSFGSSTPSQISAFPLTITPDPNVPFPIPTVPVRYAAQPEIHHIFKPAPSSPPKIITLVFTLAVLGALPVLGLVWLGLGANVNHLGKALGAAPLSHAAFFGSILGMEGVFFLYYSSWTLFQMLPVAAAVAIVGYVSGSRALTEVQERRLSGPR